MFCRGLVGLMILAWIAGAVMFFINMSMHHATLDLITALILTPLGLPWNLTPIFTGGSEMLRIATVLGTPLLNILLVWLLCRPVLRLFCRAC